MPSRRERSLARRARSRQQPGVAVIRRKAATTRQAATRLDVLNREAERRLSAEVAERLAEQVDRAFTGITRGMQQMSDAGRAAGISVSEFSRAMQRMTGGSYSIPLGRGAFKPYSVGGLMPWPSRVDRQGRPLVPVDDARVTTLAGRPIDPDAQERVEQVQQGVRRDNVRAIRVRDDHGR